MPSLEKKQVFMNYVVTFFIKEGGDGIETYRIKGEDGKNYLLKLFPAKCNRGTTEIALAEQNVAKRQDGLATVFDTGSTTIGSERFTYIIYDFIVGETLANRLKRERFEDKDVVVRLAKGILSAIDSLRRKTEPIIHYGLTPDNVMLDMSSYNISSCVVGLASSCPISAHRGDECINVIDTDNLVFLAPEVLEDNSEISADERSDIYSAGALLYYMLFGIRPYNTVLNAQCDRTTILRRLKEERANGIPLPEYKAIPVDTQMVGILAKSMSASPDGRFKSAREFIDALEGRLQVARPITAPRKKGNGFADVAGMTELKTQLQSDVIDLLRNPQKAHCLGLSIPNGLLLYGPPGCGKTFFAEKFAEEMGCNYKYVRCSDVASPYIHGGQDKIAELFNEARKNAPTVLFLDEIDSMLSSRNRQTNVSESGEVTEFLTQLNNCGEDRVIVIGATNRPSDIDEAALRAGRLELKYYVPQPDLATRKQLFEVNMRSRQYEFGIDYEALAALTENYVSADIKLIVDTAAREIFRLGKDKITMQSLLNAVDKVSPSLSAEQIREHEAIRDRFTGAKGGSRYTPIGFK